MNDFQELNEKLDKVVEGIDPDDAQEFEELMWQIKELADQAYDITKAASSSIRKRAEAYWYPTIVGLIDADAGYSGSMVNMYDTLGELEESLHDDPEEDESNDPRLDYRSPTKKKRKNPKMRKEIHREEDFS